MGERLLCKQEVIGSIPFSSTICGCVSGWARDPRWEKRVLAAVVPGRDVRGIAVGLLDIVDRLCGRGRSFRRREVAGRRPARGGAGILRSDLSCGRE